MVHFRTVVVGILSVNCHIVWHPESKDAYIIDPGAEAGKIIAALSELGVTPQAILLTHGHIDHIQAIPELLSKWQLPLWCHSAEQSLLLSPGNALLPWMPACRDLPQPVSELPQLPGFEFEVLHTPGHTPGGVCYHFPGEKTVLTGDTLFKGTYGRTDLPGGNQKQIMHSIKKILFALPGDTVVCPGHHASSTIRQEKHSGIY